MCGRWDQKPSKFGRLIPKSIRRAFYLRNLVEAKGQLELNLKLIPLLEKELLEAKPTGFSAIIIARKQGVLDNARQSIPILESRIADLEDSILRLK